MVQTKPRVAFFDFTGCEGCQLTVIDSLQTNPGLLDAVEIIQFREAMSEHGNEYQIAFVEGTCSRPEDEQRLQNIRDRATYVVALGACAHTGGVNSLRNLMLHEHVARTVYGEVGKRFSNQPSRPAREIIPIDFFIPGCPVNGEEFVRVTKAILQGSQPSIPDYPVCIECKLIENLCILSKGAPCLGPITRAGCGAICPSFEVGCEGCRGLISTPNFSALNLAFHKHGLDESSLLEKFKLFQAYHLDVLRASIPAHH